MIKIKKGGDKKAMEDQKKTKSDEIKELESNISTLAPIQLQGMKLLRGWKQIRAALGLGCSIQSVRRLVRRFDLPIFYLGNKPVATEGMLKLWLVGVQRAVLRPEKSRYFLTF